MESRDLRFGVWVWGFRTSLGLGFLLAFGSLGFGEDSSSRRHEASLKINVRVLNYAQVSQNELARAAKEATKIFREAAVEMAWLDCPTSHAEEERYPACGQLSGPTAVNVRILPASMAARLKLPAESLGYALPSPKVANASDAWVFYNRVEKLAESKDASRAQILGHAMAHEIGHLLLGPDRHSARGIMRAEWHREELQCAAQGQLLFSARQHKLIRAEVLARMNSQVAPQISVAAFLK